MLPPSGAGPSGEQAVADDDLGVVPRGGTLIVAPLSVLDAVWARELASKVFINQSALFNPKTCILIQKRHPYTGNLNSETSGDSKNAFLHCGDVLAHLQSFNLSINQSINQLPIPAIN